MLERRDFLFLEGGADRDRKVEGGAEMLGRRKGGEMQPAAGHGLIYFGIPSAANLSSMWPLKYRLCSQCSTRLSTTNLCISSTPGPQAVNLVS